MAAYFVGSYSFFCLLNEADDYYPLMYNQTMEEIYSVEKNSEWKEDFAKYTFLSALSALFLGDLEEIFNFS